MKPTMEYISELFTPWYSMPALSNLPEPVRMLAPLLVKARDHAALSVIVCV